MVAVLKSFLQKGKLLKLLLLLCLGLFLIECTGMIGYFFEWVERRHFTVRQLEILEPRGDASQISIIGADSLTLNSQDMRSHFGRYPYRRDVYKYLVDFANRANAKLISFDIVYEGGEDLEHPERDAAFAESINRSAIPVYSALFTNFTYSQAAPENILLPEMRKDTIQLKNRHLGGHSVGDWVTTPIRPLLKSRMHFHSVYDIRFDTTEVARDAIPFVYLGPYVMPTMPLALALNGEKKVEILPNYNIRYGHRIVDVKGNINPIIRWFGDNRGSTMVENGGEALHTNAAAKYSMGPILKSLLNWLQPPQSRQIKKFPDVYPKYSMWDVLQTEVSYQCEQNPGQVICKDFPILPKERRLDPKLLHDRYVLVGLTSQNLNNDVHQTIYYSGGPYPGVYIQANILDNFLTNTFVFKAPDWWALVTCLFMGALAANACIRRPIWYGVVLVLALGGSYNYICQWAYKDYNTWLNWTYPMLTLAITFTASYIIRYLTAEKRKQQLRFAFWKYVSPAVMQSIEKNPEQLKLGGQRKELTMLFSDIRGFTSFSESHPPEVVQSFLSEYFTAMNGIILHDYRGSINKLIGDAIMAYWGFPIEHDDHPFLAVCAAIKMKEAMDAWNADPAKPPLKIGIGINTGEAVIGNVGSQDFMDFTVIGDAVNLASRLESLNKEFGTTIILSEATWLRVKDRVEGNLLGEVKVKGKEQAVLIYEALALKSSVVALPQAVSVGDSKTG